MALNISNLIALNENVTVVVNQLSLSLLILLLGFIAGKLLEKFSLMFLRNISIKQFKVFSIRLNLKTLIPKLLAYIAYIVGIILALSYSGILDFVVLLLLIVFSLAVLVSIFYSIKEFIPNFIASNKLSKLVNFKLRRKIQIDHVIGEISGINKSEVKITTESGDEIHVPCSVFLKKQYKILK